MSEYAKIKDFVKLTRRMNLRGDKHLRITIDEANELQAELSLLLLELIDSENNTVPSVIHGGNFK